MAGGGFGGLAAPDAGGGGIFGAIGQGLSSDRLEEEQAHRALLKQQIQDSTLAMLQNLRTMLAQDPSKATDPNVQKEMQGDYSKMGFGQLPMTQAQPATPGKPAQPARPGAVPSDNSPLDPGAAAQPAEPGTPAKPAGIDLARAGVFPTFQEYIAKYRADIEGQPPAMNGQPSRRLSMAESLMHRPLTTEERNQLEGIGYVPTRQAVTAMDSMNQQLSRQILAAASSGDGSGLQAFVMSNYNALLQLNKTPDEIAELLNPALGQMSPAALEKMKKLKAETGKDDALAAQIRLLAQARLEQINANTAAARARTDIAYKKLPGQLKETDSKIGVNYAKAKQLDADAGELKAHADLYAQQVNAAPGTPGAFKAYSSYLTDNGRILDNLNMQMTRLVSNRTTLLTAIGANPSDPNYKAQMKQITDAIDYVNGQITQYTNQRNDISKKVFGPSNTYQIQNAGSMPSYGAQPGQAPAQGAQPAPQASPSGAYTMPDGNTIGPNAAGTGYIWTSGPKAGQAYTQ